VRRPFFFDRLRVRPGHGIEATHSGLQLTALSAVTIRNGRFTSTAAIRLAAPEARSVRLRPKDRVFADLDTTAVQSKRRGFSCDDADRDQR
jgi:hypothetical protein